MDQNPYESPDRAKPTEPKHTEALPNGRSRIDASELFGVLVRAIGLYFILYGMVYAVQALFRLVEVTRIQAFDSWGSARAAVEYLAPGVIAFFFPKIIVRLAYKDEHEQRSENP